MDKVYLVVNESGNESTVTKEMYEYLSDKKGYECRTEASEYPKRIGKSHHYELSNGEKVNGMENAIKAQKKLD